jgi:hypothetical protein
MAYAFTQDLPITSDVYQRITAALPDEPPPGMITWLAYAIEDGVRLVQVWQSEEDYAEFVRDRLAPIVQDGFFRSSGYQPPEREPPRSRIEVLNVWQGRNLPVQGSLWPGSGSVASNPH